MHVDKRLLNVIAIILLSLLTFSWTFWIFHQSFLLEVVVTVIIIRLLISALLFKDYSLSWSKVTQKTFLLKSVVYFVAFGIYMPIFYGKVYVNFFVAELFVYLFAINFLMYGYYYIINRSHVRKTKNVVIYGAGKAGLKLGEEFADSIYKVCCFVDDNPLLQKRSMD